MKRKIVKKSIATKRKLDKEFNAYVREEYGYRNFLHNASQHVRGNRVLPRELEKEYSEHRAKVIKYVELNREIESMNVHEFYESLKPEDKLKVINERIKDVNYLSRVCTNIEDDDNYNLLVHSDDD
jgi:hypothetical protein